MTDHFTQRLVNAFSVPTIYLSEQSGQPTLGELLIQNGFASDHKGRINKQAALILLEISDD